MFRFAAVFVALPLLSPMAILAGESAEDFFRDKVEPILATHCLECHASDQKGGLDLSRRETAMKGGESGAVISPGQPDESLLLDYVASEAMPPDEPLSAEEITVLRH